MRVRVTCHVCVSCVYVSVSSTAGGERRVLVDAGNVAGMTVSEIKDALTQVRRYTWKCSNPTPLACVVGLPLQLALAAYDRPLTGLKFLLT